MVNYELFEHTADVGVKIKGKDLKELFKNTALAMFDIIAKTQGRKDILRQAQDTSPKDTEQRRSARTQGHKEKKINIKLTSDDIEELFVNWLNELLSLSATKELIFYDFKINKLDENNLEAMVIGSSIKNYQFNTEIKAATYHELALKKIGKEWRAQVIFDV